MAGSDDFEPPVPIDAIQVWRLQHRSSAEVRAFKRLIERMEGRVDELEQRLDTRFDEMEEKVGQKGHPLR